MRGETQNDGQLSKDHMQQYDGNKNAARRER
jgi:hypothetical protein